MEFEEIQAIWRRTHSGPPPRGSTRQRAIAEHLTPRLFIAHARQHLKLNEALLAASRSPSLDAQTRALLERIWKTPSATLFGSPRRKDWGKPDWSGLRSDERVATSRNGQNLARRVNRDGSLNPDGFDPRRRRVDFEETDDDD